ncbi:helix-turn-helix domain-containing protein [Pseudomonas nitroreducens]|uniref:helix-turn-helix domain-containing protein n=1 Tax=Pseudomonas nitroreducens TaxID=46680 RepID=UPI003B967D44
MGGKVFGEKNGQSRLTESEVRSARRLRAQGLSYQAIASRLGVHKMTVMRACKGESWPHVAVAPAQGGDA